MNHADPRFYNFGLVFEAEREHLDPYTSTGPGQNEDDGKKWIFELFSIFLLFRLYLSVSGPKKGINPGIKYPGIHPQRLLRPKYQKTRCSVRLIVRLVGTEGPDAMSW